MRSNDARSLSGKTAIVTGAAGGIGFVIAKRLAQESAFILAADLLLERYPNVRIGFSHGGGGFGLVLPRLIQAWEQFPSFREAIPQSPGTYGRKLFFDTLVYEESSLDYLLKVLSVNQLMVGSDYPFKIRENPAGRLVSRVNVSEEDRQALQKGNAVRFLYGTKLEGQHEKGITR